jgi:hypothetical protein
MIFRKKPVHPSFLSLLSLLIAALELGGACDFGSAFARYCAANPHCASDATVGPEAGPEAGPAPAPDASVDAAPDTAIGGPGGPGQIRPPRSCTLGNECGTNEICHPVGQVCVPTCKTALDCPGYLDTCADIPGPVGAAPTLKVCTCSASQVCDTYSRGFLCNAVSNQCERPGMPPLSCSSNASCLSPALPRCDLAGARCVGCVDGSDCANRSDGLSLCSPSGSCVNPSFSP